MTRGLQASENFLAAFLRDYQRLQAAHSRSHDIASIVYSVARSLSNDRDSE